MAAPQYAPPPRPHTFMDAEAVTMPGSGEFVLPVQANGFYLGTAGHLAVILPDDDVVVFNNLLAGVEYDLRHKGYAVTGTTAANIVALF